MRIETLLGASALAAVLAVLPAQVQAQTLPPVAPAPPPAGQGDQGTIVVTGSRIAHRELQSATPVAVIGSANIQHQGITNVQDAVGQLPQIGIPGLSKTNSNFLTAGNGVATLNLRNLGDSRTLVLVNGRRFVPGIPGTSVVDVNDIPAELVDRIEVVTGGASAVYGSDAVAGVVNFILKDHFDGITLRGQAGVSARGDAANQSLSLSGGTSFGPDRRGSVIANFTYDNDEGLLSRNREISTQDCGPSGCGPQSYSSYAAQGRFQFFNGIRASGNKGFTSNLFTFDPSNNLVIGFPIGSGFNRQAVRRISTPVERYLGTVLAHYEVTPHLTAYAEATYAKVNSSSQIEPLALASSTVGFGYGIDNPFIPLAIQQQIAARNSDADPSNNVDQISFRRRQVDIFSRNNSDKRKTYRVAGGVRGDLGSSWKFDASVVYGQLKDHTASDDIDISKYALALDAIRDPSGNIVCRDPAARAAGCAPLNLFGFNSASAAAANYVRAAVPRSEDAKNTELVATAAVNGTVFELPAGPLQTSVGAEYRREKSVDLFDALTLAGLNSGNQLANTVGKFNVKEVFGEVSIPLLRDSVIGHSLSAQGAARYSDYSTIGHVFSWNAGGEYSPVAGVRFRGNYAIANRAPNIGELFSPASETFASVSDPCNGVTATSSGQYAAACRAVPSIAAAIARNGSLAYTLADTQGINGFLGGNPNLKAEKGKTLTLGVVLSPSWLSGFGLTVDYFNIQVSNAIGLVPRDEAIQQCLLTSLPQFCGSVIRDPGTGFLKTVNANSVNIAALKTRGLDFDFRYTHPLGGGRLDLHALYTHTFNYLTKADPASPTNEGVGNLEYGEVFRDKVTANLNYTIGHFGVSWTANYLSHMVSTVADEFAQTASDLGLPADIIAHNKIAARLYNDVQIRFDVGEKRNMEFFLGAKNVFDRKPPKLEDASGFNGNVTGTETAADVYDPFGRRFYAGAQIHF